MLRLLFLIPCIMVLPVFGQIDSVLLQTETAKNKLIKLLEEANNSVENTNDIDIEIDGLLVNDTKTKSGIDFYDYFYNLWNPPENCTNYTIIINEKPYRLTTTLIEIFINETIVYQALLQPKNSYIEEIAQQAVEQTKVSLQNYEALKKQLDGEDQSGTGIF